MTVKTTHLHTLVGIQSVLPVYATTLKPISRFPFLCVKVLQRVQCNTLNLFASDRTPKTNYYWITTLPRPTLSETSGFPRLCFSSRCHNTVQEEKKKEKKSALRMAPWYQSSFQDHSPFEFCSLWTGRVVPLNRLRSCCPSHAVAVGRHATRGHASRHAGIAGCGAIARLRWHAHPHSCRPCRDHQLRFSWNTRDMIHD